MAKKKSNINWYLLIVGVVILYSGLSKSKSSGPSTESRLITVELSRDVINVKGRKSKIDYKFWTKEYQNQFNILDGSVTRGRREAISNLKGGQEIEILVSALALNKLGRSTGDITVKGVSLNGSSLMSEAEFDKNRFAYKKRLIIFSIFIGLMLLINSLVLVPKKVNYALVGVFGGAILIMRIFEFAIY